MKEIWTALVTPFLRNQQINYLIYRALSIHRLIQIFVGWLCWVRLGNTIALQKMGVMI